MTARNVMTAQTAMTAHKGRGCREHRPSARYQRLIRAHRAESGSYVTINGAAYVLWLHDPSRDILSRYRRAGIVCSVKGQSLYIHHQDENRAQALDDEMRASGQYPGL